MDYSTDPVDSLRTTFRPSFLILWAWLAPFAVVVAPAISFPILLAIIPPTKTLNPIFQGAIAGLLVSVPVTAIICFAFPQSITPDGVHAHSFWGIVRFTPWGDIASIRPFSLLGLKYLRLDSRSNGKTAYLCLFSSRKSEFKQSLLRLAPPDHPIRAYFS